MANDTIKTALGTYQPSYMVYEACALLAMPKAKKPAKSRKPSVKIGSKVLVCGRHEATVIAKHANRGWWTFQTADGRTSSCDRKLMKVIA